MLTIILRNISLSSKIGRPFRTTILRQLFDLKSGYHHIEIFQPHLTYLGFQWEVDGVPRYFCFAVLPFGLSTAPYIFTKVCRPLVKLWRLHGIKIVLYLDHGFSTANSHKQCFENFAFVNSSLLKAGFLPDEEKNVWNPTQICEWLGIIFNTIDMTLSLPQEKFFL